MIFAAIDWAQQKHFVILMDAQGQVLEREWIEHEQQELSHLDWLLTRRGPLEQMHLSTRASSLGSVAGVVNQDY